MNFHYDALGRRVARTVTGSSAVYVQMDQQTIADYPVGSAASTPTYRYVYAIHPKTAEANHGDAETRRKTD